MGVRRPAACIQGDVSFETSPGLQGSLFLLPAVDAFAAALTVPAGLFPDRLAEVDVVFRGGRANNATHDATDDGARADASAGHATDHGTCCCTDACAGKTPISL
jgi:hypothetical protein